MSVTPFISVVSPEYNGARMISEFVDRVAKTLLTITDKYEIILVNDSSPDDTWNVIQQECKKNPHVKGIDLSRNFGQHYAISAGLALANGDWVVVMDCDLQDVPEDIPKLYQKAIEGYDLVMVKRTEKYVGWWKRMSSVWFHKFFNMLSGANTEPTEANFSIICKKVVDEYNKIPMQARSYGIILSILGFKKGYIDLPQEARGEGKSGYTLRKLFLFASTVIIATTNRPLRLSVSLGFIMSFLSFALAVYNVIAKLLGIIHVAGYTTTVFSIWFVGGMLLSMIGVLGLYIGKIFDQVKGLPIYVIREKINF